MKKFYLKSFLNITKINFLLIFMLFALNVDALSLETSSSNGDTLRLVLLLSPGVDALNLDVENDLVLEAYKRLEDGVERTNQMFGNLNDNGAYFLSQRDYTSMVERKPLAKVVKTIVLDTLSNYSTITDAVLSANDPSSETYDLNPGLEDAVNNANAVTMIFILLPEEIESINQPGVRVGNTICVLLNQFISDGTINTTSHEFGHMGILPDTTITQAGDTIILQLKIGHTYSLITQEEYPVTISGIQDTVDIDRKSLMNGSGPFYQVFFSRESANGVANAAEFHFNRIPHFEDKRFFITAINNQGIEVIDSTDSDAIFISSKMIATSPEENMDSWIDIPKIVCIKDNANNTIYESNFSTNEASSNSINLSNGDNDFSITLSLPGTGETLTKQLSIYKRNVSNTTSITKQKYISVYPNPSNKYLNINYSEHTPNILVYSILDSSGKQIQNGSINKEGSINIENLSIGKHYINFQTASGIQSLIFFKFN